jgi:ankyrin repeat protein
VKDLNERATTSSTRTDIARARAAYQLAVLCFEGNVLPKDMDKCLQWLGNAARDGDDKAISACSGLHEACDSPILPELAGIIRKRLPEVAKADLMISSLHTMHNVVAQQDSFVSVRQWAERDSMAYSQYLASHDYHAIAVAILGIINIRTNTDRVRGSKVFDFKKLDGYDPQDAAIGVYDIPAFISSVRRHKCKELTDIGGMTMLQRAAALGDLALAMIMVTTLGAEVDGVGDTPGWTPLWISCCTGNIEIAGFLAEKGANPRCKDRFKSRTILHFLNKCRSEDELMKVFAIGLRAGIDLEEKDADGHTPLLSSFIGWDFSHGLSARYLLGLKANVLVRSPAMFTPLEAAVRSLDTELVTQICGAMDRSLLMSASDLRTPEMSPEEAKAYAFLALGHHTGFYNRRIRGKAALSRLCQIVDLLLDEGSMRALKATKYASGTNALISACYLANEDLATAVLESKHCPPVDDVDDTNGMTALHWAAHRGKPDMVVKLLCIGADHTIASKTDHDAFQYASINSPQLIMAVLRAIEDGRICTPDGLNVSSILGRRTTKGETLYDLMVIEGNSEHLKAAEALRIKYSLPYDEMSISRRSGGTYMTLTAWLIDHVIRSNVFSLEQVEYLLDMDPPPRFIADSKKSTLLHYAVDVFQHGMYCGCHGYQVSRDPVYFLIRTFLQTI